MKTFIAIVVAVAVGSAGAYYFASKKTEADVAAARAEQAAKVADLGIALTNANVELGRMVMKAPAFAVTPPEILQRLALIDPTTPEMRTRKIREIIHQLECLVDDGTNSFQPIRQFLATGVDVNYTIDDARSAGVPTFWTWRPGTELRSGLVLPPTLRISLVDVIRYIGGEDAEVSLAWMLNSSAQGMEIPYVAQALEKIAPGRYTDLALQAAKNYLAASATNASPTRASALGDSYIYNWLGSRGDTSLVAVASQSLVNSQGKLDVEAARYLVNSTKGGALDDLAKVYNSSADNETKAAIANMAADYVGSNPAADSVMKDWLLGTDAQGTPGAVNGRPREPMILLMGGGTYGPYSAPVPTDPNVINPRITFLQGILPQLTPRLQQAANDTIGRLQAQLTGHPGN